MARIGGGLLLTAAGILAAATAASAATPVARHLLVMANRERAAAGLPQLVEHPAATAAAEAHCRRMAARDELFHDLSLGATVRGWRIAGENVGLGKSVQLIHQAFMASAAHRANILGSGFRFAGVCALKSGDAYWVTEVFFDAVGSSIRTATAERAAASRPTRTTSAAVAAPPPSAAARAIKAPVRRAPPRHLVPAEPAPVFPSRTVSVLLNLADLESADRAVPNGAPEEQREHAMTFLVLTAGVGGASRTAAVRAHAPTPAPRPGTPGGEAWRHERRTRGPP